MFQRSIQCNVVESDDLKCVLCSRSSTGRDKPPRPNKYDHHGTWPKCGPVAQMSPDSQIPPIQKSHREHKAVIPFNSSGPHQPVFSQTRYYSSTLQPFSKLLWSCFNTFCIYIRSLPVVLLIWETTSTSTVCHHCIVRSLIWNFLGYLD